MKAKGLRSKSLVCLYKRVFYGSEGGVQGHRDGVAHRRHLDDGGLPQQVQRPQQGILAEGVADLCLYSTNLESLLTTKEFTLSRISAITIIEVLYLFLVSSMPAARRNISKHEA